MFNIWNIFNIFRSNDDENVEKIEDDYDKTILEIDEDCIIDIHPKEIKTE